MSGAGDSEAGRNASGPAPTASRELDPADVAAIVEHMNDDHADAVLACARAFGDDADVTAARMTGIDRDGVDIAREGGDGDPMLRVPFPTPLRDARDARRALISLTRAARERLGPERGEPDRDTPA